MSLTIELTPAEEARLNKTAQQEGVAPAELVRQLLERTLPIPAETSDLNGSDPDEHAARVAQIRSLRGKLAHLSVTTEELHRERQADKVRESEG